MREPNGRRRPGIQSKIYVAEDMIGPGKVAFLAHLAEAGSMAGAAARMGVDDARAAFLLETLQACFAAPLIAEEGERVVLTALGSELMRRYEEHQAAIEAASAEFLDWLAENQP